MACIWFIDNKAACSLLVKGTSSHSDLSSIACITHLLLASLSCRCYFEWVDSEANLADGLSRDGLEDAWTKSQGWDLQQAQLPEFARLRLLPFAELCKELAEGLQLK
jgi:hypothetical protein